jgi:hypothetical protein
MHYISIAAMKVTLVVTGEYDQQGCRMMFSLSRSRVNWGFETRLSSVQLRPELWFCFDLLLSPLLRSATAISHCDQQHRCHLRVQPQSIIIL